MKNYTEAHTGSKTILKTYQLNAACGWSASQTLENVKY